MILGEYEWRVYHSARGGVDCRYMTRYFNGKDKGIEREIIGGDSVIWVAKLVYAWREQLLRRNLHRRIYHVHKDH